MTTLEKARQNWQQLYWTFGKGKAEMAAYQEYIAISQGRKAPKHTKVKSVSKQADMKTAKLL